MIVVKGHSTKKAFCKALIINSTLIKKMRGNFKQIISHKKVYLFLLARKQCWCYVFDCLKSDKKEQRIHISFENERNSRISQWREGMVIRKIITTLTCLDIYRYIKQASKSYRLIHRKTCSSLQKKNLLHSNELNKFKFSWSFKFGICLVESVVVMRNTVSTFTEISGYETVKLAVFFVFFLLWLYLWINS